MSSLSSLLLCLAVDVVVAQVVGVAQLSPRLTSHPFLALWGGGILRACVLHLLIFTSPGSPQWMKSHEGRQTVGVLSFLSPVYITLLWATGQSAVELLWGWHSWQGVDGITCGWCVVAAGLCGGSCGEMAIPHYTGKMTDWIMNEDEPEAFTYAITVMSVITVMSAVCEFVCDLIYNVTMSKIHMYIQGHVFQSVLKQEIGFFDVSHTGDIVSRITTDTNTMSESLSEKLSLLMWYFMRVVFLFGFMVNLSWKLSLFTALGLPVIWVVPELSGQFYQSLSKKVQESLAKANDVAMETFSSMKTVRSFANEDGETKRYEKRLEETYSLNKEEAAAYAASTWTNSLSSLALKVSILYYGGRLVTGGTVSSGDLVSFVLYELQFSSAVEVLMSYYPHVKKAIGASEKIFEYVDREPRVPPEGSLAPQEIKGHVHFRNISFAYAKRSDTLVLKGVSLELKPGQMTAVVGPSGGGKSTLVNLLERFYQPKEGDILLDGESLQSYKIQYLHDKISVVSQEPKLFARSLKDNIKYGKEDATNEEVYRAAKLASAHKFISQLPDGYETDAGSKGDKVSGGQKQRIAIARALIRHPKILVLDDATSSLDTETEFQVHQALDNLRKTEKCSVLLIAHRLSAVKQADHIIFLQEGEIKEEGTHDELVQKDGLYAELVRKQNMPFQRNTGVDNEDDVDAASSQVK
uniref:Uncharacterized protein n=1 Tax=Denticeps clupeoides TaxID=299321 RepID=A0AAY4AMS0_9TELE